MPPATGHQIVQDIKDLFSFVAKGELNKHLDTHSHTRSAYRFNINPAALAVSGSSAGGLCAYLAAMHSSPRPIALLSMYGMGGDFLTPHYLVPKHEPFFRGREILDPNEYKDFLFPQSQTLPEIHHSPLAYHDKNYVIPGFPANPRMLLARLYLQLGGYLDYWTGEHDPSLSSILRKALITHHSERSDESAETNLGQKASQIMDLVPPSHRELFPQFNVSREWPPTFLCHGSIDTAVPVAESKHMYHLLKKAGVPVQLDVVEGMEHSFDYECTAEEIHGDGLFHRISEFLVTSLCSDA